MAINYTKLASIAQRLIESNGNSMTIVVRSSVPTDSSKPWRGTNQSDEVSVTVTGVILPFNLPKAGEYKAVEKELYRRGAASVYIAANSTTVDLKFATNLIDSSTGLTWQIQSIKQYNPGGISLLWEAVLVR